MWKVNHNLINYKKLMYKYKVSLLAVTFIIIGNESNAVKITCPPSSSLVAEIDKFTATPKDKTGEWRVSSGLNKPHSYKTNFKDLGFDDGVISLETDDKSESLRCTYTNTTTDLSYTLLTRYVTGDNCKVNTDRKSATCRNRPD